MSIFNFFRRNDNENQAITLPLPTAEVAGTDKEESVSTSSNTTVKKPLTVSWATGWPIDVVYGYLNKDYEQKGFDDAMVKNDLAFRDLNADIIRNKILMVIREIKLSYDVRRRDLQTRIDNCNDAGLLTTSAELQNSMSIIDTHKEELQQLEASFRNNSGKDSIPVKSYTCGFLRGIATTQAAGFTTGAAQTMAMPSNYSQASNL